MKNTKTWNNMFTTLKKSATLLFILLQSTVLFSQNDDILIAGISYTLLLVENSFHNKQLWISGTIPLH